MIELLTPILPYVITVFVVIAGLLGFRAKSMSDGKKAAESAQNRAELRAIREAREVEETVNAMTSDAKRDELAEWIRG